MTIYLFRVPGLSICIIYQMTYLSVQGILMNYISVQGILITGYSPVAAAGLLPNTAAVGLGLAANGLFLAPSVSANERNNPCKITFNYFKIKSLLNCGKGEFFIYAFYC